jgi:serine/threonine protein kinase
VPDVPRVQDKVGSGNCGTVVTVCEDGEITAVKVPLNPLEAHQMHGIVKQLCDKPGGNVFPKVYPNINTTIGPGLRMEYFPGAQDLDAYLVSIDQQADPTLFDKQVRLLLGQVLQGAALLHKAGYVHGSLKPGNIIVSPCQDGAENETNPPVHAKIIDFGWTRQAASDANVRTILRYPGTAKFAPPEAKSKKYIFYVRPQSAEIWTIGATFYFAITRELVPIDAETSQVNLSRIENNALRSLLARMMHEDPEKRITAAQALQDTYFTSI